MRLRLSRAANLGGRVFIFEKGVLQMTKDNKPTPDSTHTHAHDSSAGVSRRGFIGGAAMGAAAAGAGLLTGSEAEAGGKIGMTGATHGR